MKLRILIVDDEAPARRRMAKLIRQESDCDLIGEAESGAQAIDLIRSLRPNLILLDIQLKDKTGFDVMKAVGSVFEGVLIFITAFDEHAIQAFEINAIDYLLKPYKTQRFVEALERARRQLLRQEQPSVAELLEQLEMLHQPNARSLRIPEGKTIHYLDATQLEYIQADGAYCLFYAPGQVKTIRISLKKAETLLPGSFVRISRSVIINRGKISRTRTLKHSIEIEMSSGVQFMAGRSYLDGEV